MTDLLIKEFDGVKWVNVDFLKNVLDLKDKDTQLKGGIFVNSITFDKELNRLYFLVGEKNNSFYISLDKKSFDKQMQNIDIIHVEGK